QKGGVSYTSAFADALIKVAREDSRVFALTAAMPDGTGLNKFQEQIPERYLDGGIAESATVDIAAGMCKAGMRPVTAIYSTFLQRAFDQIFQEVVLQGLPVIFALDRAGLVGGDGPVHHGFADIAYLRVFPKMVLMAPADAAEIESALRFALSQDAPAAIRYPRDTIPEPLFADGQTPAFELGRSVTLREGDDAVILAYGSTCRAALDAAEVLSVDGIETRVVNARFAKPVDQEMVGSALALGVPVLTVEDHSVSGGFGSAVLETAGDLGLAADKVIILGMPADRFVAHGPRIGQLAECGIDAAGIAASVREALGAPKTSVSDAALQRARDLAYVPTADET
ncbi:MAG: hypothetical protein B6D36_07420, partial [Planctomycetes bacterium UTPLA1]